MPAGEQVVGEELGGEGKEDGVPVNSHHTLHSVAMEGKGVLGKRSGNEESLDH